MGWFLVPYIAHCFFHLLLFHFPSSTSSVLPLCNHDDSSALLRFKNSFAVASYSRCYGSSPNKTASWKKGTNCCKWDGVTCDTVSGHVTGLDLSCSMLRGELHPNSTLFRLTHLQQLNLAYNDFTGSSICSGIGDLVSLTRLNLSHSAFGGDIPSTISHLSKLVSLDLSSYDPRVAFSALRLGPSTWNKLIMNGTNIEELVLDNADMSSIREGSLSLLMNLSSSLVSLHMDYAGLQGNFPGDILCSPNLQELSLSDNRELRGELPKCNWSAPLRLLDLGSTAFSGEIPSSIGHLKSLNKLSFEGCQFDGVVPLSLWNLTQLASLDLSSNNLNGEIPSLLSNLKHLIYLSLGFSNFSGQIPDVFGNLTKLEFLSLRHNNLGGQLPSSLLDLTHLSTLYLHNNKLVGPLPSKKTTLSKLETVSLEGRSAVHPVKWGESCTKALTCGCSMHHNITTPKICA